MIIIVAAMELSVKVTKRFYFCCVEQLQNHPGESHTEWANGDDLSQISRRDGVMDPHPATS